MNTWPIIIWISWTDRLSTESSAILSKLWIEITNKRKYINTVKTTTWETIQIMQGKRDFIINGVLSWKCNMWIIGKDKLLEYAYNECEIITNLWFGKCSLRLGIPNSIKNLDLTNNSTNIITSYPILTQQFLDVNNYKASINRWLKVPVPHGSVEWYPALLGNNGENTIIADITETGSTMIANDIRPADIILDSEACLFMKKWASQTIDWISREIILNFIR
jgi:ATP phosphoribosyltransferase